VHNAADVGLDIRYRATAIRGAIKALRVFVFLAHGALLVDSALLRPLGQRFVERV
jgi:hypothetical protein